MRKLKSKVPEAEQARYGASASQKSKVFAWLFCFFVLFLIFPPSAYAVVEDKDYPQPPFVPNQVIVRYKQGYSPEDLNQKVWEQKIRGQSFIGRLQNFGDLIKTRATGNKAPQEQLSHIEEVSNSMGVITANKIFEKSVLGDGTETALENFYLYVTDGIYAIEEVMQNFINLSPVASVQPNYLLRTLAKPNDTYYSEMWNLSKINMEQAWDQLQGENKVITAVVDTGVDTTHEDLQGITFVPGRDFAFCDTFGSDGYCCESGLSQDPICTTIALKPCPNFDNFYCDDDPADDHGHGTYVTGIITAVTNNQKGIAGIGWTGIENRSSINMLPVKVLNKRGEGTDVWTALGIVYAAEHGAKVLNLSLGREGKCSDDPDLFMQSAIDYALQQGATVIVAAGNENKDAGETTPSSCTGVIAVGATGPLDERAEYSNFGVTVDLAAPGGNVTQDRDPSDNNRKTSRDCIISECILSTITRNPYNTFPEEKYAIFQGTSAAAPHVAAAAALLLSINSSLTSSQIEQILKNNGDQIPTDKAIGKRLNVYNTLLSQIGNGNNTTPTPTVTIEGPTLTPLPSITAGGPTLTPTVTPSHPCLDQAKKGDYNCDGQVDNIDFNSWLADYKLGKTTLPYFEYWRRAFYSQEQPPVPCSPPNQCIPLEQCPEDKRVKAVCEALVDVVCCLPVSP